MRYATFGLLAVKGLQELKAEKDDEIQQLRRPWPSAMPDCGTGGRPIKILELEERLNALAASNTR